MASGKNKLATQLKDGRELDHVLVVKEYGVSI